MKKAFFFLLMMAAVSARSQSLKEALYGGKLKTDSGSVLRKGEDLTTKIDTATRKPAPPAPKPAVAADATVRPATTTTEAETATGSTTDEATPEAPVAPTAAVPVRSNARIWKAYSDSLVTTLKTDLQSNKKIKKGDYFLTVEYDLETDGKVTIVNVVSDPENPTLQAEVRDRMELAPLQLAPAIESGKAKKVKRRYNFPWTKE